MSNKQQVWKISNTISISKLFLIIGTELFCMAANSQSRRLASVGKRFVTHITSRDSSSLLSRRSVHVSAYDKNLDEHVRPTVVPDNVIQVESDKYWAPHPQTGVFGPAADNNLGAVAGGEHGFHTSPAAAAEDSVLEQKAFFRPLEDLEKPSHP